MRMLLRIVYLFSKKLILNLFIEIDGRYESIENFQITL